jgi:hypothetical protein
MLLCEVTSVEKDCKVLLNMDLVVEIAPLKNGGSAVFFADSAAVNGKIAIQVKESYDMFKQFAVHTVSSDDIARKISSMNSMQPATIVNCSTIDRVELPTALSTPIRDINDQITDSVTQTPPARRIPGRKKPGRKPGQVYVKKAIETTNGDDVNG